MSLSIRRCFITNLYAQQTLMLNIPGTELVGPSYRLYAGFLVQSAYSIGFMTLAIIAYLIRDWKYIELAITLPVVFPFVPYYFLTFRTLLFSNLSYLIIF
jgi:hypothetical protein